MAYQNRLDQLESEVFQTNSPSQTVSLRPVLPYAIIAIALLVSLYTFCPDFLQTTPTRTKTNRNPSRQIRKDRFFALWLIMCLLLGALFYKYGHKYSEKILG